MERKTSAQTIAAQSADAIPSASTVAEPSQRLRASLLDPAAWREPLQSFANVTHVAVALADVEGRLLGECVNPRPLWSLLQNTVNKPFTRCPFSFGTGKASCTCIADAIKRGTPVTAIDRVGLTHVTVPLVLGGVPIGALLAGQVFDRYPEQLVLEQLARKYALDPFNVEQLARHEIPVKAAALLVYGELLANLGNTFLQNRYEQCRESDRLAEMTRLHARAINENTERRRAEEALRGADRHKDEFLATLAHELRNPLAPISNAVHLLRLTNSSDPATEQLCEMMERQVGHLVRLVDDLMEVSRITRGKVELRRTAVELAAVIRGAVEECQPLIETRRHQLTVTIPPEPVVIHADPDRLIQVFANLLTNAAKYMDEGGQIWLQARRQDDSVVVSVRDLGIGIPAEMLPNIFQLFTQVDRSTRQAQWGLGIGLTLVQTLVEMHGGQVEAHSPGLGKGSEFIVRLPLQKQAVPTTRDTPDAHSQDVPGCRVLVVDDNRDAAQTLGLLLERLGAEVRVASDGPAALRMLPDYQPAVVVLDIGMPGMDGYEVARRIRQQPEGRNLMLIALTGWGQEEDRQRAHQAGFDHHLPKPPDMAALTSLMLTVPGAAEGT